MRDMMKKMDETMKEMARSQEEMRERWREEMGEEEPFPGGEKDREESNLSSTIEIFDIIAKHMEYIAQVQVADPAPGTEVHGPPNPGYHAGQELLPGLRPTGHDRPVVLGHRRRQGDDQRKPVADHRL